MEAASRRPGKAGPAPRTARPRPRSARLRIPAGLALAAALSAAAPEAGAAESVSIRFREHSVVDGPSVRLGEIARIIAGEERVVAELETLEVAKAAGFGLTRLLDTEQLYARHLRPWSERGAGLEVDAERKSIRVTTRSAILPADSLARVVDAFLALQPRRRGETWTWEIARAPAEIKVPAGPHSLELAYAGMRRKGKVELNLAIRAEARTLRTVPIAIHLRVEEDVLVALRPIGRDEALSRANVAVERRETTLMGEAALGDPGRLLGRTAKAGIQPGRIITPRLLALPPAVRRGQEAKLVYRNGDVNIVAGAVCRQDGVPGQIITAKSLVTQRLVRVRVTEDGLLEPVPGG